MNNSTQVHHHLSPRATMWKRMKYLSFCLIGYVVVGRAELWNCLTFPFFSLTPQDGANLLKLMSNMSKNNEISKIRTSFLSINFQLCQTQTTHLSLRQIKSDFRFKLEHIDNISFWLPGSFPRTGQFSSVASKNVDGWDKRLSRGGWACTACKYFATNWLNNNLCN